MRNELQPGSGVRTIGGMYATVKEVNEDTVLLDAGPGVELLFAKNAIGAVLTDDEYNRIVHGIEHDLKSDVRRRPGRRLLPRRDRRLRRRSSAASDDKSVDLGKKDATDEPADETGRRGRARPRPRRGAEEDRRRVRREVATTPGRRRVARPHRVPGRAHLARGSRHHVMAAAALTRRRAAREGVREGGST